MKDNTIATLLSLGDNVLNHLDTLALTWAELHEWRPSEIEEKLKALSTADVAKLTRSLVLLDTARKYASGSVAPAIWFFQVLERRNYPDLLQLAEWIDKVNDNPYLPFGTQRYRSEYFEKLRRSAES